MRRAALALLGGMLVAIPPAMARHDETPIIDISAYTLRENEWRLGIWRFDYGITDTIQIGTIPLAWTIPIPSSSDDESTSDDDPKWKLLSVKNANAKWTFFDDGAWAASVGIGIAALDPKDLSDDPPTDEPITMIPLNFTGTYREGPWSFHLGLGFTKISGEASDVVASSEDTEYDAVAAVSTGVLLPAVEWRLGPVFALTLESKIKLYQETPAEGSVRYRAPNGRYELEVFAAANSIEDEPRRAITLSGYWSWDTFNLVLGLTRGHFAIPVANIWTDEVVTYPAVDAFWRF